MTTTEIRTYAVGSLVSARGREWVVLPGSDDELLVVRPLGGTDDQIAGLLIGVEDVGAATFDPPAPDDIGDDRSARMLRDALRIGFRSSGGPFRCLAGVRVSPRPYQLVPLLLALRHETVRLLIADDVGIGKTVESGLIAAELLAQGSAQRLTVLCPPSLAEQWRGELKDKFGLTAQLVIPGTVTRLERGLEYGQSIFEHYPITIVSTDYIKAERRRDDFLRAAPELIIIDEAHGCVTDDSGRTGGRTQRYRLVRDLAADSDRHLLLVTATPHSGNDGAFRNLIALLDPELKTVNLAAETGRRRLADHMVQRQRADIRSYLGQDTQFPSDRETAEAPYALSPRHADLFADVFAYVRGQVRDRSGTRLQQRIRWWSALSLLRAMASSPAAALATLGTRAATAEAESESSADQIGSSEVLDLVEDDSLDGIDTTPGARLADHEPPSLAKALRGFERRAAELVECPVEDAKLAVLIATIKGLHKDGYDPVVFCRFITTAKYVADQLRTAKFPKVTIETVTGELPSEERADRVAAMVAEAGSSRKVLVATDCLSEGVNLQNAFQAVVHYDLAWNPTRHEQREGRVDRFGQPYPIVRALMIFGSDNGIDDIIMKVLLRKHQAIRRDLGVSVAAPPQTDQVLAALLEGVLAQPADARQLSLDYELTPEMNQLEAQWTSSAEDEKKSRARFAQATIRPDDVRDAVEAATRSLGTAADVAAFTRTALEETGCLLTSTAGGFAANFAPAPVGLIEAVGRPTTPIPFVPDYPAKPGEEVLARTDPAVTAIAQYVMTTALDAALPDTERPARRCGLVLTKDVAAMTTALLIRFRTHLTLPGREGDRTHLAEEARVIAFTGPPTAPNWLAPEATDQLLIASPAGNVPRDVARNMLAAIITHLPSLTPHLEEQAQSVADRLREDHVAVRLAARGDRAGVLGIRGLTVTPQVPVDVLGVYVFRPVGGGG